MSKNLLEGLGGVGSWEDEQESEGEVTLREHDETIIKGVLDTVRQSLRAGGLTHDDSVAIATMAGLIFRGNRYASQLERGEEAMADKVTVPEGLGYSAVSASGAIELDGATMAPIIDNRPTLSKIRLIRDNDTISSTVYQARFNGNIPPIRSVRREDGFKRTQ